MPLRAGRVDLCARPQRSVSGLKPRRSPAIARTSPQQLAQALQYPAAAGAPHRRDDLGEPIVTAAKALACRATCFIASCCSSIRRSAIRSSASTRLAVSTTKSRSQAAEHMVAIWQALRKEERAAGAASSAALERRDARPRAPCGDCNAPQCAGVPRQRAARRVRNDLIRKSASAFRDHALTHKIEKIPPGAVLDLDDPDVGVEFHFAREIGLDRGVRAGCSAKLGVNVRSAPRA